MPSLRATILDHRGKRVPLVPHEATLHFGGNPERNARLKAAADIPGPKPSRAEIRRGILYGFLAVPFFLAAALTPSFLSTNVKLPWWARLLVILPVALVPMLITVFVTRRVAGDRIARIYISAGYCPSCAYDLTSLTPDHSGLIDCPECGSSWRLPHA